MTSKENIALNIIFGVMGESNDNRTMDEYLDIAARAPKLEAMHEDVNRVLRQMAEVGYAPYEICYFKAGDRSIWFERFPKSLSRETIRSAWIKSGMRELQKLAKQRKRKTKKRTH